MPAAAWAARSGDPVLFVSKDAVPKPTLDALRRHEGVPVFVLGPRLGDLRQGPGAGPEGRPRRAAGRRRGPGENAIAFARYASGSFGWDINDPGMDS